MDVTQISMFIIYHLVAITGALVLDMIIGDPEHWPHPVRWFGNWIAFLEKRLNRGNGRRRKGFVVVLSMTIWTIVIGGVVVYTAYHVHPYIGIAVEALLIAPTIATKSLADAAIKVLRPLTEGEIERARYEVGMIVGRDTDQLNEGEIARATVETVAENTSDGITAPLLFALIGGAPLALFYRAINTCDSMVGYKNDRYGEFGYASAKTDDLLNYVPSRLTAFAMLIANRSYDHLSFRALWRLMKRDARKHPSPNSGYGESAMAALLGIRLGGLNMYKGIPSHRPEIGDAKQPLTSAHIKQSVSVMRRTVFAYWFLLCVIGGVIIVITYPWS
ncbi:adenosylcobinamide-phosphate synthase CbiB [Priestia koreensis]|uniref:adenosylcobinamide-phosphate synthase CbiB n=1 Tax=Priestia koreensis TaxID=284581 RepID=UPI001F5983D5|nr:adenosylcobinamide-phosphate synthase CbiB [Priestia koreensis]MCM3006429.1 adenosylcobinamide-phosphate synthase CbiB [Priestia koreensis]UNL83670.1 cobalamin biosynthesis protein [Priestia koreensis]